MDRCALTRGEFTALSLERFRVACPRPHRAENMASITGFERFRAPSSGSVLGVYAHSLFEPPPCCGRCPVPACRRRTTASTCWPACWKSTSRQAGSTTCFQFELEETLR